MRRTDFRSLLSVLRVASARRRKSALSTVHKPNGGTSLCVVTLVYSMECVALVGAAQKVSSMQPHSAL